MGLLKKKEKKKKEKKPITFERVLKWLSPIFIVVLIFFAGYQTFESCGFDLGKYRELQSQLNADFDVNTFLSSNKIIVADEYNLKVKMGPSGADVPIFVNGEISADVFNNLHEILVANDLTLTSPELGCFVNIVNNFKDAGVQLELLELGFEIGDNNSYTMISVCEIDISGLDLGIEIDTSNVKNLYIKTISNIRIDAGRLKIVSTDSQLNALSDSNNDMLLDIVNGLLGKEHDFCAEMIVGVINDYIYKTATTVVIDENLITFLV